jgi:hypothetical protein
MFDMHNVESSNIHSIGYDQTQETARVCFKDKKGGISSTYDYAHVPPSVFDRWLKAPSAGKFFQSNIKSVFPGTKV